MLLWATFAGVQFGTYEQLRRMDLLNTHLASRDPTARARHAGAGQGQGGAGDSTPPLYGVDGAEKGGRARGGAGGRGQWGGWGGWGKGGVSPAVSHFVHGAIAGCTATVASYPFDIARTALAFQVGGCFRSASGGWGRVVLVRCIAVLSKTIDPRIPTMLGRSTSDFHRPGRHRVHQARGGEAGGGGWESEGGDGGGGGGRGRGVVRGRIVHRQK